MDETFAHVNDGDDPISTRERRLSRCFILILGLWFVMGLLSIVLQGMVQPPRPAEPPSMFSDELDLMAKIVNSHGAVLRMSEGKFDTSERLSNFNQELALLKNKLRDLSLVVVQDPWSRELLLSLRKNLIISYYEVQLDVEKIRTLGTDSPDPQKLFESAHDRLKMGRNKIADTTRQLGIRPQEVLAESDALQRVYGIVRDTSR